MTLKLVSQITLYCEILVLIFLIWSIAFPKKRIWPSESWKTIGFWFVWVAILIIFLGFIYLSVFDFNTWVLPDEARYFLGLPIFVLGTLCTTWAIALMGAQNTLGIENAFITKGPYKYSRNPQYLGDILIIVGAGLFINSITLIVPALLACLGFWLMPLPEEDWLKERYGQQYIDYYRDTSRFI